MPKLRVFCILVLGATVTRAAAGQSVGSQVRPLLSKGPARVEVMEPWAPPRLNELSVRVQRAAQADPRWWEDRVRNAGSGPLPYDPKLGITENEYRELQRLADSVQLRPARTETIDIEFTPTGWRFGRATTLFALRGLEIDTVANKIVSYACCLRRRQASADRSHGHLPQRAARRQRTDDLAGKPLPSRGAVTPAAPPEPFWGDPSRIR